MSSFINNIIKVTIKEINKNSSLTIKGPVNQEYDNNDPYNKTLKFIVSNDVRKTVPYKELLTIKEIRRNLEWFLQETGLTKIEEGGVIGIQNPKPEENDLFNTLLEEEDPETKGMGKLFARKWSREEL